MFRKAYNLFNLLFLWVMSEFQANAKFIEPEVAADVLGLGCCKQALESPEHSREERKIRTVMLIVRLGMAMLLFCALLKYVGSSFLVCWGNQLI